MFCRDIEQSNWVKKSFPPFCVCSRSKHYSTRTETRKSSSNLFMLLSIHLAMATQAMVGMVPGSNLVIISQLASQLASLAVFLHIHSLITSIFSSPSSSAAFLPALAQSSAGPGSTLHCTGQCMHPAKYALFLLLNLVKTFYVKQYVVQYTLAAAVFFCQMSTIQTNYFCIGNLVGYIYVRTYISGCPHTQYLYAQNFFYVL